VHCNDGLEECDTEESDDVIWALHKIMKARTILIASSGHPGSNVQEALLSSLEEKS
jgi:hypothetical protein